MTLLSINMGRPRLVAYHGQPFHASIFKTPVSHPVALRRHRLEIEALSAEWFGELQAMV